MQKQPNTYYILIAKMKHSDVAYLRLQDEVKSNRLRARRVKSEDNLADIGTEALSNRIIRQHAISMGYVDAQENLRLGDVMGPWGDEAEQEDQSSSAQQNWCQLVAMPDSSSGSEGSRISLRVHKRDDSKPDVSPSCCPFPKKRIVTVTSSDPHVDFLMTWFAASTKFLDDVVVVATENDAMASADVNMVQQLGRPFPCGTLTRFSSILMARFQEKGQLISLTVRWGETGAQLSMRQRHPRGFVRRGRVVRWRRHVTRDCEQRQGFLFHSVTGVTKKSSI